ncbi:MAG: hypothetical protein K8S27_08875 [Candidatus Omnitrophica bacterium]|nr:hypothetical protein [Candidatus Omnitrophota bacterium]
MIKEYTRQLNDKEKNILRKELKTVNNRINSFNKSTSIILLIIFIIGLPLAGIQIKKGLGLAILAFVVFGVFLLIPLWVRKEEKNKEQKIANNINITFEKNSMKILHCQSLNMYKLKEYEDEGPHYLFQVEENKILFIGGQEFYESKIFPNTDFEIATAYGEGSFPAFLEKYYYGEKLKPLKTIAGKEKWKLLENRKFFDIENIKIIDGTLGEIDKILNI